MGLWCKENITVGFFNYKTFKFYSGKQNKNTKEKNVEILIRFLKSNVNFLVKSFGSSWWFFFYLFFITKQSSIVQTRCEHKCQDLSINFFIVFLMECTVNQFIWYKDDVMTWRQKDDNSLNNLICYRDTFKSAGLVKHKVV